MTEPKSRDSKDFNSNLLSAIRSQYQDEQFTEEPSDEYNAGETAAHGSRINATELFSFFTADIIKLKVVFIR